VHAAGTLTLQPARIVRGRVLAAAGIPAEGVAVWLWGCNADHTRLAPAPAVHPIASDRDLLEMYIALRKAWTDARGEFAFGDVPAGEFDIMIYGSNNVWRAGRKGIAVAADADPKPIEIQLDQ
jgi:protocatechuate 3,4-dioxygenase beta subunit